jgi:hypothetical protein
MQQRARRGSGCLAAATGSQRLWLLQRARRGVRLRLFDCCNGLEDALAVWLLNNGLEEVLAVWGSKKTTGLKEEGEIFIDGRRRSHAYFLANYKFNHRK